MSCSASVQMNTPARKLMPVVGSSRGGRKGARTADRGAGVNSAGLDSLDPGERRFESWHVFVELCTAPR